MIKPFEKPIYVTRPFLPPIEEFCQGLEKIWETRWLTNDGPILRRFTQELCNFFETDNVCLFNNEVHVTLSGAPLISLVKAIKAVTYHNLKIRRSKQGFEVEIVFDV